MLEFSFLSHTVGSLLEVAFLSTLGTVLGLGCFIKGVLLTLKLSLLVLVVLLSLSVGIVFLLDHLLERGSLGSEDVQLSLNVSSLFKGSSKLVSPQFPKVFKSIRKVGDVIHLGDVELLKQLVLHGLLREDPD